MVMQLDKVFETGREKFCDIMLADKTKNGSDKNGDENV
jgi:hypothetical protein